MARRLLVWVALAILSGQGVRGSETTVGQVPDTQPAGVVRVGARVAFVMTAPVGSISAAERADIVNRRIETVLGSEQLDPQQIIAGQLPDGSAAVVLGDLALVSVTPADAAAEADAATKATDAAALATHWARVLREEITQVKPLYQRRGAVELKTLSEHHVLLLIVQVALLLLAARIGGELASRVGQSPVIGQLLAGVALGPSALGQLLPEARALVFPVEATQSYLLEVVSWLGVLFLLLLAGLESDLAMMRAQGKAALGTSLLGAFVPLGLGIAFGLAMPGDLVLSEDRRWLLALFLGTSLAVSSVPVIATILMDMGRLRDPVGQITLAAALAQDTLGWMLLAMIAAVADGGVLDLGSVARTVLGTVAFGGLGLTIGRRLVAGLLEWVRLSARAEQGMLTASVVLMLLSAAATQWIGVHAVLGAFLMGMILRGLPELHERVVQPIEAVTMGVFAPIFFAAAGLNVSLAVLAQPRLLALTLGFTAVACLGKIVGCYAGGRWAAMGRWEALSVGFGTNARGAMGLIVGILGFSLGLLTVDLFSILIIMALLTTAFTPPLLRWSLAHVARSEADEPDEGSASPLASGRLMVADWGGPGAAVGARLAGLISGLNGCPQAALQREVDSLTAGDDRHHEALLAQIQAGDTVVLGSGAERGSSLSPLARAALRAGHAVIIAQADSHDATWPPTRVLLATKGVGHGVLAAEVAASVSAATGAELLALHVLPAAQDAVFWLPGDEEAGALAQQVSSIAQGAAARHRVTPRLAWCHAPARGPAIVEVAAREAVDLIVLGGTPRPGDLLALGGTVAHVLAHAACPVVVAIPPALPSRR